MFSYAALRRGPYPSLPGFRRLYLEMVRILSAVLVREFLHERRSGGQVTFTVTWKAMITPHSMMPDCDPAFGGV